MECILHELQWAILLLTVFTGSDSLAVILPVYGRVWVFILDLILLYGYYKATHPVYRYVDIKKQYPDAFLLFRMGDFYELFYEDAVNAAQILEISLTSRNKNAENPIPMAG